jgi:DNA-binding LytR/AlgR family response regulator
MYQINSLEDTQKLQSRFLVYVKNFLRSIETKDIAYFYTEDKITYVMTKDGERCMIHRSLNHLEQRLDPRRFFRINRMFIISFESILKMEPYFGNRLIVFLRSSTENKVIVSREKVADFKDWLNN